MEANLRFKIVWTSLIVGRKLAVFALFYFVFEGHFQVQALGGGGGAYIRRGQFNGRFFALRVWGAYIWRAYTWRGLAYFWNFTAFHRLVHFTYFFTGCSRALWLFHIPFHRIIPLFFYIFTGYFTGCSFHIFFHMINLMFCRPIFTWFSLFISHTTM